MFSVLGFDIGGANTKAALVKTENGKVMEVKTIAKYFPFWKRSNEELAKLLLGIKDELVGSVLLDCVAVTLTAELSDVFATKRQGVNEILDMLQQVFEGLEVSVLDIDAQLISVEAAKAEPLKVSAANWVATGWMVSQILSDCVVVDVGSTSTSIIPIENSRVVANGRTDLEKLVNGELVYTGSLRTNVAAIVQTVPVKTGVARVSSELFALSGDVHLLLNNIAAEDFSSETADGKGKSRFEALTRLSRVVCADTEMLKEQEVVEIAKYVYAKQVEQIAGGLSQVYSQLGKNVPIVVTGLGREFLARKAAEKLGIESIISLDELMPKEAAFVSPAMGVSLMAANKFGCGLKWKQ